MKRGPEMDMIHSQVGNAVPHAQTTMRAVQLQQYGGPEVLLPVHVPVPVPQAGEVLIRVRVAAVNPSDLNLRAGRHTVQRHGLSHHPASRASQLPITLGMEVCGDVVALGEQVPEEWLGRRVAAIPMVGGYAEYVVCPLQRVFFPPAAITDQQAAASAIAFLSAYYMLHDRVALQPGETVLITAASGTTGNFLVQLAQHKGAHVLAVASRPEKARWLQEIGLPTRDIVYRDSEDVMAAVWARTNDTGVDVLLDGIGGLSLAKSIPVVKPEGRIVLYGNLAGVPATLDATRLIAAHQILSGFSLYTYLSKADDVGRNLQILWDALLQQPPQLYVPTGQWFPLEEAARAHLAMQERRSTGKTLLRVS